MKQRNLDHKNDWKTPDFFYNQLNEEFNFDFDPCPLNHNVDDWNGLEIDWKERNFINPPYSRKLKEAFIRKAIDESNKGNLCVMLLPVSTSTKIFHEYIKPNAKEIRFIKGRIPFIGYNNKNQRVNWHLSETTVSQVNSEEFIKLNNEVIVPKYVKNSGQHDSMIVIFNKD